MAEVRKLTNLNKRRSTMGCSAPSSHITKATHETAEITAKVAIKGDESQSNSLPLSNAICIEATAATSKAMPTRSIFSLEDSIAIESSHIDSNALEEIKIKMEEAIGKEDYEKAAKLRDRIQMIESRKKYDGV